MTSHEHVLAALTQRMAELGAAQPGCLGGIGDEGAYPPAGPLPGSAANLGHRAQPMA